MENVDLDAALEAVRAGFAERFPGVNVVIAEDAEDDELPVPALVCQISEIEPDPDGDPLTGQFPCLVRVQARIVLGRRTPAVRMQTLKLAGAVAAQVHAERFGVKWGAATVIAVEPDEFAPAAARFDVWLVEWVHAARLGDAFELPPEFLPSEVLVSHAPRVGIPHEADYEEAQP
ncbi:hypothetical protein EU805_01780 [Salipiger sp. IMCC34102]|uniref:hypothetical protein n=1 Tax=Salipiger sp. IMCC34102 TaxID=2510647 RepID=UPI00101D325E|nr:hypothetical protein [Salipiger sp. IMCC34102]RYH04126.1 hypothetical protein EU805_01780 [Salipiger sp. IMCC34102]